MGSVYLALDARVNNMPVGIKEMSTQAVRGDLQAAIGAFEKEASLLSSLRHPALPRINDFFSRDEERWYLVMDYIEGQTLKEMADNSGPIAEVDVLNWGRQLGEILDYLHKQNPPIIFRDLKPANIMLTPEGQIKLIDFGIARHFRLGGTADTSSHGTRGFAPPEQYGANQTDPRSDIYALGATLHYFLTGQDPSKNPFIFEAPSRTAKISPRLETAIMKALEMKAENRPQNMQEMLDLLPLGVERPTPGKSLDIADKSREKAGKTRKIIIAVGLLVALIYGGVYTLKHSREVVPTSGINEQASSQVINKPEEKIDTNVIKQKIVFNDAALEKAIRAAINKPEGEIYADELKTLQELDLSRKGINDIIALRGLTNLKILKLSNAKISDRSVLQGLTSLQTLELESNYISDISCLQGLSNLRRLDLNFNEISDLNVLQSLPKLQMLDLYGNRISEISGLQGLTNLLSLNLKNNAISDISIPRGLTNLQYLDLSDNKINDISCLQGLTNLQGLDLSNNQISDISALQGLTNLQELYLKGNVIKDYSPVKSYYKNLYKRDFNL